VGTGGAWGIDDVDVDDVDVDDVDAVLSAVVVGEGWVANIVEVDDGNVGTGASTVARVVVGAGWAVVVVGVVVEELEVEPSWASAGLVVASEIEPEATTLTIRADATRHRRPGGAPHLDASRTACRTASSPLVVGRQPPRLLTSMVTAEPLDRFSPRSRLPHDPADRRARGAVRATYASKT